MIYAILSKLFREDVYNTRFVPMPKHLLYAVALLFIGSGTFGYGWYAFGFLSTALGIGLGLTILVGMNWDKAIEYWDTIAHVLEAAGRIKDPIVRAEILHSMGYNVTPETVTIIETQGQNLEHGWQQRINRLPVSPTAMQVIADKVLMSGNALFTEPQYKGIVPNYRKVQKELKSRNLIVKTKDGHVFNKKGVDALWQYASESVKLELRRKRDKNE